ncbi:triphosphoribosyl-dephospho-CoA synthase CitG [Hathewaya massiliensis]|uniref:triphosphoribosyl-dephospho-CoA synthase CitG n=1 Tax=Hathewaya massiliensis TaxID=1964382 RepID=UPI001158D02D|nr:triphosphoribosyl-dephospho-CoA synthase CitG [Hathewaya massiliensis]
MNKNKEHIIRKLGEFASEAMLYEVSAYPKPGLVTPNSKGAHEDMDYFTFLSSISALNFYMYRFAEAGFSHNKPKEIFSNIRVLGVKAEKAMMEKTDNTNTHKGMIFLMGISLVATAKTIYEGGDFSDIRETIKDMTEGIVDRELKSKHLEHIKEKKSTKLTYGEKLYFKYGIKGIRGEVERGIPVVFEHALPTYRGLKDIGERERLIHTLICIMAHCEDSTVLHRNTIDKLYYVQEKAKYILSLGGFKNEQGRREIENLDREFCNIHISPGGCADLLAITIFFSLVYDFMGEGTFYE